jgi:hypothetical protein
MSSKQYAATRNKAAEQYRTKLTAITTLFAVYTALFDHVHLCVVFAFAHYRLQHSLAMSVHENSAVASKPTHPSESMY